MESSRKAKVPSRIVIEPAKNGGHVVEHHYDNFNAGPSYQGPEKHAFGDHAAMIAHVAKHTAGGATPPAGIPKTPSAPAPGPRTYGAGAD